MTIMYLVWQLSCALLLTCFVYYCPHVVWEKAMFLVVCVPVCHSVCSHGILFGLTWTFSNFSHKPHGEPPDPAQRPFEAGSNYAVHTSINEMVSLGDKAISLHILQPPTATRGGCSVLVKTQSAKSCLNLNFRGGDVFCSSENSKCQNMPKFQFSGKGEVFCTSQNSKCQDLPKFQFLGEGDVLY